MVSQICETRFDTLKRGNNAIRESRNRKNGG